MRGVGLERRGRREGDVVDVALSICFSWLVPRAVMIWREGSGHAFNTSKTRFYNI